MKPNKQEKRIRRHNRVRAKVVGTPKAPRLCVFKSNQHIYAQIIDDAKGKTIISAKDTGKKAKLEAALDVGKAIAKLAIDKKIKQVVFDRGGFKYHGRIRAVAEGAREGGLQF
ncbi:MAG: 50S ribosomal protein L18 [bacterium]